MSSPDAPLEQRLGAGAVRRPHPALRRHLTSIVGYCDHPDPRSVHHGLPSPAATVILAFDEPLDVGWLASPEDHDRFWSMASGLHPAPALIRTHGVQHGIQLALTPVGVRSLLGVPVGELGSTLVDLTDLGVGPGLVEQLSEQTSWKARLDLLEERLLERLDPDAAPATPELGEAWRLLQQEHGRVRVTELATKVGWSRRWLHKAFVAEYGLGPQLAGRLFRFDRARRLVDRGSPLADAARQAGYADQAHFNREWSTFAGTTPTGWLESPWSVPDSPNPGAGSTAPR